MKVCPLGLAHWLEFKLSRVFQEILLEAFKAWPRSDHKSSRTWPTSGLKGIGSFASPNHVPCDLIAGIEFGCDLLRKRLPSGTANCVTYSFALNRNSDRSGSKTWTSDTEFTTANRQILVIGLR